MANSATPSYAPSVQKEYTPPSDNSSITEKADGSVLEARQGAGEVLADGEDTGVYPTGLRMASIVVALVLSIFLVSLDLTIVGTAIPAITEDFQGLDKISWYGSAFFLTFAAFQSTWGKAYKYFPLKITFLMALFVFEIGSLLCGTFFPYSSQSIFF